VTKIDCHSLPILVLIRIQVKNIAESCVSDFKDLRQPKIEIEKHIVFFPSTFELNNARVKLCCNSRFQRAGICVFKVINLVSSSQRNYFENATRLVII